MADLELLLKSISEIGALFRSGQLSPIELRGMRFGNLQRDGPEMQPEVLAVFDQACAVLERAGAKPLEVQVLDLELADAALLNVLLPEASAIHARWLETWADDYARLTRMQIELGFPIPAVTHVRAQQYRRHLTQQFLNVLEEVDAILSPTVAFVAPFEDPVFAADDLGATEARRTGPYNLTGLPALTINCGFGQPGLPVGLQILTRPHADALALAIGSALENLMPEARAIPTISIA
jgi:aspartyl-tRNA(Asn)/glutamyl-tRNA(Gln) amidotransferase subunit A